jgi:hypothetical protein
MKNSTRTFTLKAIAGLLVPVTLSCSIAQAAETVPWNDLPEKIGKGKMRTDGREDRQYRVVTTAGVTHSGYNLAFTPGDVKVTPPDVTIPREQVKEIRIARDPRLRDALFTPGVVAGGVAVLALGSEPGIAAPATPGPSQSSCIRDQMPAYYRFTSLLQLRSRPMPVSLLVRNIGGSVHLQVFLL